MQAVSKCWTHHTLYLPQGALRKETDTPQASEIRVIITRVRHAVTWAEVKANID